MNAFNYKEMQIRARVFLVLLQVLAEEGVGGGEGCNNNLACMITITFQSTEKGNWTVFNFFFSITTLLCSYGKSEKMTTFVFSTYFHCWYIVLQKCNKWYQLRYYVIWNVFYCNIQSSTWRISTFFFHLNQSTKSKLICWN